MSAAVYWFTGLSGAGKTTLATKLVSFLREKGEKCELLDGDEIRKMFPQTGFSREERNQHIQRVAYIASLLEKNGVNVVVSLISPYKEGRSQARKMCRHFIEIYVSTPLAICEERDPKGLYKAARRGDIQNFTGISDDYEAPPSPDLTIETSHQTLQQSFATITDFISKRI